MLSISKELLSRGEKIYYYILKQYNIVYEVLFYKMFKCVSIFYENMTLTNLYKSIHTSETELYKSFGDQRLKERNQSLAIVQIYELGLKVNRLINKLEKQMENNEEIKFN